MKILVLGAGMYVTGRNGSGNGTVLSSLCELSRHGLVSSVNVVSKRSESAIHVTSACERINKQLGTKLHIEHHAINSSNDDSIRSFTAGCDAAILALPDNLHYHFGKILLECKLPVLFVKPFTSSLAEARELVALQRNNGIYAAVEFHKRWDETNLLGKRLLQDGALGDLLYCNVAYSQRVSIPRNVFTAWAYNTNILQYLGVHYIDLFYFLTGAVPRRVSAIGTEGLLKECGINPWDSVHATIIWEDNKRRSIVQHVTCNWIDPEGTSALSDQKYQLVGTKGRLDIDQKNRGVEFVADTGGLQSLNPYFAEYMPTLDGKLRFSGYGHSSISSFISDVKSIKNGECSMNELEGIRPTINDALISTAVIDYANRSLAKNGLWEDIFPYVDLP